MDLSCIKARVENHFYRRIDAIKHDLKYLYTNAASFNRPKSDIVRNAKVISNLAMEVVGGTTKTKDDVSSIYHGLVQNFQWSESEKDDSDEDNEKSDANSTGDDDDEEEDDEDQGKTPRKSSARKSRKNYVCKRVQQSTVRNRVFNNS